MIDSEVFHNKKRVIFIFSNRFFNNTLEPKISVIIPTHNSEKTIENCIHSIVSQNFPRNEFEIIVVDDGSKDNTVKCAKKAGADVITLTEPCFQGAARNIGAKNARGFFFAFIDSDCTAGEDWLDSISKELENNKAIGGPVLNGNSHSLIAWAEYLIEFSEFHEYRKRTTVPFVPGCNIACIKDVFFKVGGFSEQPLSEDVAFGNSLTKAGINIVFVPELKVNHLCRTEYNRYISNMKLGGKYSIRASKDIQSIYTSLSRSKWLIPAVFIIKLGARARRARSAKKLIKFIICFPIVILGVGAFCSGVSNEI